MSSEKFFYSPHATNCGYLPYVQYIHGVIWLCWWIWMLFRCQYVFAMKSTYEGPSSFCWQSPFFFTSFLCGNRTAFLPEKYLLIVDVCFLAKSTDLLPNSQEGSKRIHSVPSSANAAHPSSEMGEFEEGEADNLGRFPLVFGCLPRFVGALFVS